MLGNDELVILNSWVQGLRIKLMSTEIQTVYFVFLTKYFYIFLLYPLAGFLTQGGLQIFLASPALIVWNGLIN